MTGMWCLLWASLGAPVPDRMPPASALITNISSFYGFQGTAATVPQPIRAEFLIYFAEPNWRVYWGEFAGEPAFLPLFDAPRTLKTGQRLRIDGKVIPSSQRFIWSETTIEVVEPSAPLRPIRAEGLLSEVNRFNLRYVEVDALGDVEDASDPHVLKLGVLIEGQPARVLLQRGQPGERMPDYVGSFLRIRGVFVASTNALGRIHELSFWASGNEAIQTISTLAADPRFDGPVVPAEKIATSTGRVKVRGTVRNHDRGTAVVLWDDTGQVRVESPQSMELRVGDVVEAVGRPAIDRQEHLLRDATYRLSGLKAASIADRAVNRPLRLAAQVRDLRREDLDAGLAASIQGVVAWAHPDTTFAFVLDGSGGIRVVDPKLVGMQSLKPRMQVHVEGLPSEGGFVPIISNAVVRPVTVAEFPVARPVSLEQAMTGVEDGNWVEMRGYLRSTAEEKGLTRLELSTWGGSFRAWVPTSDHLRSLVGAIVRVQGVCGSIANTRRQLTGIELWIPQGDFVQVDTPMPPDVFALPIRPLGGLRQFSAFNALNERVRTRGTVILKEPGRGFQLQDGRDGIFVSSRSTVPLKPGDLADVVGFPGNEGGRFLLREAVYRIHGAGPEPEPIALTEDNLRAEDVESLLVRTDGELLDVASGVDGVRFLLQSPQRVLEAHLDDPMVPEVEALLQVGSRLSVVGVCRFQRNEFGEPNGPVIHLRGPADIQILRPRPWWTLARLLWALGAVLGVSVVAVAWGGVVLRKNHQLRIAQEGLRQANERLEARVAERTEELRAQIAAKERAHAQLSESQLKLMQTSRLAGMAEVATGVLHNVGNVLNSMSVSSTVVMDALRRSPLGDLGRAAALLRERDGDLVEFLAMDPKGRLLPEYLGRLADQLTSERANLVNEMNAVGSHIQHIKEIVAMQQNYARVSGAYEALSVPMLVDDALQMNAAAFARHEVAVIREFAADLPPVHADRHKVLQILINLFSNAKYAMDAHAGSDKKLVVRAVRSNAGRVQICVRDSGAGIAPENLVRIFRHGFTTRKDGHGFGLHSSANAAAEMNGSLTAHSDGPGRGASFTLELPEAELPNRVSTAA